MYDAYLYAPSIEHLKAIYFRKKNRHHNKLTDSSQKFQENIHDSIKTWNIGGDIEAAEIVESSWVIADFVFAKSQSTVIYLFSSVKMSFYNSSKIWVKRLCLKNVSVRQ